jgi:hypothetical protein
MYALTGFGLFAVTAMLVCYALADHSHWFVLASKPERAHSDQPTASFKVHGHSAWSKLYGRALPSRAGIELGQPANQTRTKGSELGQYPRDQPKRQPWRHCSIYSGGGLPACQEAVRDLSNSRDWPSFFQIALYKTV